MKKNTMRPGEIRQATFDFTDFPEIVAGDTLSGTPAITIALVSGAGTAPTIGTPAIASGSKKVTSLFTAINGDTTWRPKCLCTTTGGSTLACEGLLDITDL